MLTTLIARLRDGYLLAESMEDEKDHRELDLHKKDAKKVLKKLSSNSHNSPKCSIDAGKYTLHYLVRENAVYLTICEKSYPKRLAFSYLDELQQEFHKQYGGEIEGAQRPYAFIKFDTFIQKTKKLYSDTRTQRNLSKLNDELGEVETVLKTNIAEVLGRGERLEGLSSRSAQLQQDSMRYVKDAKYLNFQLMFRAWAPVVAIVLVVIFLLWIRFG